MEMENMKSHFSKVVLYAEIVLIYLFNYYIPDSDAVLPRRQPHAIPSVGQQVMPDPHPISWGRSSQGMPVLRTNRIPVRHFRSSIRGAPLKDWVHALEIKNLLDPTICPSPKVSP